MPHTLRWMVPNRVIYTEFHGKISQAELEHFISEVRALAPQGTPLVHHLSNSLGMEKVEFSLAALQTLARAAKMAGELGWNVDVNRNPLLRMFSNFGAQFANARTRTFTTLADAIHFLKDVDTTLIDLPWLIEATPAVNPPESVEGT